MIERTTPGWAVECTDRCGLSRFGHYACAFAGFVAAVLVVSLGASTVLVALGIPESIASFTIVFGFFGLWAGTWLATEVLWHHWIARRVRSDAADPR
jgi:hypothetical protein